MPRRLAHMADDGELVDGSALAHIARLKRGNKRFQRGDSAIAKPHRSSATSRGAAPEPFAIVMGPAETLVPIEAVFDTPSEELIVQTCMGSIAGRKGATHFNSLEYAILRYQPKLLLVLGNSESEVMKLAIKQVHGQDDDSPVPSEAMRFVLNQVMVSAMRAAVQAQKEPAVTAAGRDMKIAQIANELNTLYTIEQLMRSAIVRNAVRHHGLELHGGILDATTGEVEFIGRHPQEAELMNEERQPRSFLTLRSDD